MGVLHRGLFTWFVIAIFLIVLCLRLESRTEWNWFIVFIPMWLYDAILLIYVMFHMISHCKHGAEHFRAALKSNIWYVVAVLLKIAAQIIICLKLQYRTLNLSIYYVMIPLWILLPTMVVDVTIKLIRNEITV